jgi:hypothetical protein
MLVFLEETLQGIDPSDKLLLYFGLILQNLLQVLIVLETDL